MRKAGRKRLSPGRSAPPPTAGGVKLLFSCHAPHVVVFPLAELRKADERRTNTIRRRLAQAELQAQQRARAAQQRAHARNPFTAAQGLSACAVERARLGPSGSAAGLGRAAPVTRILSPACAGECARLDPSGSAAGLGRAAAAQAFDSHDPRARSAREKGAEASQHTHKTHKRTNR